MRTFLAVAGPLFILATPLVAQTPSHFWSQRFGSTLSDAGYDVAVDASGNVLVTGTFSGTVDFGGGPLVSAGNADIFVAKYNPNGVHLWSQRFGGANVDNGIAIAVDASGNVLVTGLFSSTVDFGGTPLVSAGGNDIFLAKYNASGVHQWSKQFGSTGLDVGNAVAVDGSGNVLVTGQFTGTVDFGGGPLVSAGNTDLIVARYSSTGIHQWSKQMGSTNSDIGIGVAADGSGNVLVTGLFYLTVDFGGGPLVSAGSSDIFVAKYNSGGAHQWSKRFGSGNSDLGSAIVADGSGNVLVTGQFSGTVDFGGGPLVGVGNGEVFVAKYNSSGAHQWSQRFGGPSSEFGDGIAVDGSGSVFVTGTFASTVDFGGGPLTGAGTNEIFLAKYSSSGAHQWSQRFGNTSTDDGNGVATDAAGNVFMTGSFSGIVDFGGGLLTGLGGTETVLAKYGVDVAKPDIAAIADIGNDQGRRVRISFGHSGQDVAGAFPPVTRYEAFRRVDPLPVSLGGPTTLATGWDFVADVPAHRDNTYEIVVETLADSTVSEGMYRSVFFIRAATDFPQYFYDSAADSGYSLDDLAPSAPANFVLTASVLSWKESKAADFDYFSVYGSASNVFDASAVLLDQTINTSLDVSASVHAFYYVTATDFSGNEGRASRTNTSSGIGGPGVYSLAVNAYPNPFNPTTTIRYDIPSRGRVVVAVYGAKGEEVTTLVDEERAAGSYPVRWGGADARGARASSGVYFVRLQFGAETRARKIVLLK